MEGVFYMQNKKILMYAGIIVLVLIILGLGYLIYMNVSFEKNEDIIFDEYTPEAEITDEQLRETIVTLYFMNIETGELMAEARPIDAKELLENPYKKILELLIDGPKNKELIKIIPEGTYINSISESNGVVTIDFSEEFIKEQILGKDQEEIIINSITNTLTELTEVSEIKILINGEENKSFPDGGVNFSKNFSRN